MKWFIILICSALAFAGAFELEAQRPKFEPPPKPPTSGPLGGNERFNPGPPPSGVDCLSPPMPPGADQWDRWSRDMDFWRCMRKRHGIEPDQPTTPWPGPSRLPTK